MDSELQLTNFRVVGHGGFSTVYVADQQLLGRQVAVKVLRSSFDDDATWQQFLRECQASGQLSNHPGVVTVYDASRTSDGRGYIVMEFLKHGALSGWTKRQGSLNQDGAAAVGVSIASALEAAHAAGIRHRDVKPANLLIGEEGQAKLGDFGISRVNSMSSSTTKSYTPEHVSPEVLRGESSTFSSDLYSLASTLYQLVEGHSPYARSTDESPASLLIRKVTEPAPNMSARTGPAFSSLVMAGLSPNPDDRPLLAEFSQALRDLPQQPLFTRGAAPIPAPLGTIERSPLTPSNTGDETTIHRTVLAVPVATEIDDQTVIRAKAPPVVAEPIPADQSNGKKWAVLAIAAVAILALGGLGLATTLTRHSRTAVGITATTIGKTDPTSASSAAQTSSSQVATNAISPASTTAAPTSTDVTAGSSVAPGPAQSGGVVVQSGGNGASNTGAPVVLGNTANPTPANAANPAPASATNPAAAAPAPVAPTPASPTPVAPTPVAPTTSLAPLPGPTIGSVAVSNAGSSYRFSTPGASRCQDKEEISIAGPSPQYRASGQAGYHCYPEDHSFGPFELTPGSYTATVTLTLNGKTASSSASFVVQEPVHPAPQIGSVVATQRADGWHITTPGASRCMDSEQVSISGPSPQSRTSGQAGWHCYPVDNDFGPFALAAGSYTATVVLTTNGIAASASTSFTVG
jgi:serine/threonine protein kinase